MKTLINKDIEQAIAFLEKGNVIAVPTETVYGLAAAYDNPEAIRKIFEVNNRPSYDPLILHTASVESIKNDIVTVFPPLAEKLAERFWPGPLTMVLPRKDKIDPHITARLNTVAVRIPDHDLFLSLLKKINKPLAAPSANPFGYISPTTALHVKDQLDGKIPFILDGGAARIGLESSIVKIEKDHLLVLRAGGVPIEELREFDPHLELKTSSSKPDAPGMLEKHYAPHKKLYYQDEFGINNESSENIGLIRFRDFDSDYPVENQIVLSPEGQLDIAARKLYSAIREMDNSKFKFILTEKFPEEGLGLAMNDRIRRAVTRK